jgi:uncharacterized repeat protein (TIGR03803 family)
LVGDTAGNLYGTTIEGGTTSWCPNGSNPGCGVVFKLSRYNSGYEFKVLHTFTGGADGGNPFAPLVRDAAGNLYGTTWVRGAYGAGVVFKLIPWRSEPSGYEFKVHHTFTGGADGGNPFAGLVPDAAGNLYGTTSGGGAYGHGVVFRLAP